MNIMDLIVFIIPIVSSLIYGGIFLREYNTGFIKIYISRINKKQYVAKKIIATALKSVGTYLLIGGLIILIYTCFFYSIKEKQILPASELGKLILILLRISIIGGIIATVSGILGTVFLNYYMAYGLPFVMYYLLVIIKERYLEKLYTIYPIEWMTPKNYWGKGNWGLWAYLVIIYLIVIVIYKLVLDHRLQEVG